MTTSPSKIGLHDLRGGISDAIRMRGITKRELALKAGVCLPQVYNFLSGRANLGAANIERLLGVLQVRLVVVPEEYLTEGAAHRAEDQGLGAGPYQDPYDQPDDGGFWDALGVEEPVEEG